MVIAVICAASVVTCWVRAALLACIAAKQATAEWGDDSVAAGAAGELHVEGLHHELAVLRVPQPAQLRPRLVVGVVARRREGARVGAHQVLEDEVQQSIWRQPPKRENS